ncbi:hypothetical protein MGN70_002849 [Eutypa lata]|nr:hypothetical protein MGN70_002849 [Eutypa lata]
MALPTDPSSITIPTDIDAPSNDTAVTNSTGIAIPVNETALAGSPNGDQLSADVWRYIFRCHDSFRRVRCVNYFDSYCTNEGWVSTDAPWYCVTPHCYCVGYDAISCPGGSC